MTAPILVKGLYSIEAEISEELLDNQIDYSDYHSESDNIKELLQLHECSDSYIQDISEKITNFYQEYSPIWEDWYISWWWHIHIFDNKLKDIIKNEITPKQLKYLLLNNPFWVNYSQGVSVLRKISRRASFSDTSNETYDTNSKWKAFCFKDEYYSHNAELDQDEYTDSWLNSISSFEFRVNDVIDWRVFYMYKAMILAKASWKRLKKTSEDFRNYLKKWIQDNIEIDTSIDVSNKVLADYWYTLSEEDKETTIKNMYNLLYFAKHSEDFNEKEIKYMESYIESVCERIKEERKININFNIFIPERTWGISVNVQIEDNRIDLWNFIWIVEEKLTNRWEVLNLDIFKAWVSKTNYISSYTNIAVYELYRKIAESYSNNNPKIIID